MKKILSILLKLVEYIIILFILVFVVISLTTLAFPEKDGFFGYKIYTVVSDSMFPDITVGDVLLVKVREPKSINVGDVVVYQGLVNEFKDKVITHRVVSIKKEEEKYIFTTKGTANVLEDPSISEEQIYGVVENKLLVPSFIRKAMSNPIGFILVIVIPMLSIMLFESKELKDLMKKSKELKKKKLESKKLEKQKKGE